MEARAQDWQEFYKFIINMNTLNTFYSTIDNLIFIRNFTLFLQFRYFRLTSAYNATTLYSEVRFLVRSMTQNVEKGRGFWTISKIWFISSSHNKRNKIEKYSNDISYSWTIIHENIAQIVNFNTISQYAL